MPFVPGALIATAALNVPGLGKQRKPDLRSPANRQASPPPLGLTLSQVAPPLVMGLAVKFVMLELELDRETVCDAAAVLPGAKTKLSELGFAEIGLRPAGRIRIERNGYGQRCASPKGY